MTSPAPVDVKGQGKARRRRRPKGDAAAQDASGPPQSRSDAPDEEAAAEAAPVIAPEPNDAGSAAAEAGQAVERQVRPSRPTDPDAAGDPEVVAAEEAAFERFLDGPPKQPTPAVGAPGVDPTASARPAARQRRAQEQADQAAEIEAAALAESAGRSRRQRDREQPVVASRRSRRQQQALERMATKAAEAAAGDGLPVEESRRERRQHKRAAKADDQARRSRRDRKARKRRGQPAESNGAAPAAAPAAEPAADLAPESRDRRPPTSGTDDGGQVGEPTPTPGGPTVTGALTASAAAAAAAAAAASASAETGEPGPLPRPPTPKARERPEPTIEPRAKKEVVGDQAQTPALAAKLREGARWLDRVGGVVPPGPTPSSQRASARPKSPAAGETPAEEEAPAVRGTPAVGRQPVRTPLPPPGPKPARESARPAGAPPSATRPAPDRRRPPSAKQVPRAVVLRQRRRRRRMIIGTTVLLVVVNLLVGSAYVYFQWRLDQINRVAVAGLAEDAPGEVMNVLLVGSDSRERLEGLDAAQAGKDEVAGKRSDTIMVLHVDPRQQRAAILAIPRDLYVPIPGTGGSDRVNAAFAIGGAERLIAALSGIGVQVNHYAEVDFVGFKEIVDAIGGVPVFLPNWVRDFSSGLDVPRVGCVELNGAQALAYVRSRQFESLVDGRWVTDPRGDLGRIERQQDFIRRVMKKGVSTGISNPLALNRLIGIGVRNLTVDNTMSTSDMTNVARRFRTVDPDSVETLVLPTTPQTIDGKSVLVLQDQEAQDEIAKINGAAPEGPPTTQPGTTVPPAESGQAVRLDDLRIQVLNGTGVKGSAGIAADALKRAGLSVVGVGDADPALAPRTIIRYRPGQDAKAQIIQNGLQVPAQLEKVTTLTRSDVVLVLGTDYTGFKTPGAPAGEPTPTPVPETNPDRDCS